MDLCHYQGYVKAQKTTSWAAISTCNSTFHGLIHDGQELWHLHSQGSHLYLYQHSKQINQNVTNSGYQRPKRDIAKDNGNGLNNDLLFGSSNEFGAENNDGSRESRTKLRGPWNANKRSRYVELVLGTVLFFKVDVITLLLNTIVKVNGL